MARRSCAQCLEKLICNVDPKFYDKVIEINAGSDKKQRQTSSIFSVVESFWEDTQETTREWTLLAVLELVNRVKDNADGTSLVTRVLSGAPQDRSWVVRRRWAIESRRIVSSVSFSSWPNAAPRAVSSWLSTVVD